MEKSMPPSIHTLMSKKPSRKDWPPLFSLSSWSSRRLSSSFSIALSHVAWLMPLGSTTTHRKPSSTVGTASSRNSHCQLARPPTLSKLPMIQPEMGLPSRLDSGRPIMNRAMMRLRR